MAAAAVDRRRNPSAHERAGVVPPLLLSDLPRRPTSLASTLQTPPSQPHLRLPPQQHLQPLPRGRWKMLTMISSQAALPHHLLRQQQPLVLLPQAPQEGDGPLPCPHKQKPNSPRQQQQQQHSRHQEATWTTSSRGAAAAAAAVSAHLPAALPPSRHVLQLLPLRRRPPSILTACTRCTRRRTRVCTRGAAKPRQGGRTRMSRSCGNNCGPR